MDLPVVAGGDVLAQPTRARIFARLTDLKRAASSEELAVWAGLHVNGVRRHLERLSEAGLVERTRTRHGRGRPRDAWAIAAGARPAGARPEGYAELAAWLALAIPAGPGRLRQVKQAGREIGRALAPGGDEAPQEAFRHVLTALGFDPHLRVDEDGTTCCRLGNCPYTTAVHANAEVVCTLHEGITAGLAAALSPAAGLTRFVPHDPETAGCEIELSHTGWHETGTEAPPPHRRR